MNDLYDIMEKNNLIDKKIICSNEIEKLIDAIKNNNKFTFYEFKRRVVEFTISVMKKIESIDNAACFIETIQEDGWFNPDTNAIVISENVVKKLYKGNVLNLEVILHELYHFKEKYDILSGKVDKYIIRSLKEQLLREATQDPFNEKKSIKCKPSNLTFINDDYYNCNYSLISDENMAVLSSMFGLITIFKAFDIKLSENQVNQIAKKMANSLKNYENKSRDFRNIPTYNSYFLSFEEAFDLEIEKNPNWLSMPQFNIEYYLDENCKVKKRTLSELRNRLEVESNDNVKGYLIHLIDFNEKVNQSKSR